MNKQEIQLGPAVELPTEVAVNIRSFFGRTAAPLDEIGLQNIVALENAIAAAVINPEEEQHKKGLLEKVVDEDVKIPKTQKKEPDA